MNTPSVQSLYELAKSIVAVGDTEEVRGLLQRYEAGEIEFEDLLDGIRALSHRVH